MPLTFPSHAAAVVPLTRAFPRLLWPAPLILGSATPDLSYALDFGGYIAHRWDLFLLFCVPVGLFFWFWLETLVLPALTRSVGEVHGVRPARIWQTRGLPRTWRGWLAGALSIAVGATTHVLWDGFTHRDQWPANLLYPEVHWVYWGRAWYLANLLQYASSLVGLGVMGWFAWRALPQMPEVEPGRWRNLVYILLATAVVSAVVIVGLERQQFVGMNVTSVIWFGFWKVVGLGIVVLTAASVLILRPFTSGTGMVGAAGRREIP